MKRWGRNTTWRFVLFAALGLALFGLAQVAMGGSIHTDDRWAWGTSAGWINFGPLCDGCEGVAVHTDHLEGYAWGENIGWIRLGTHTGGGAHTYGNTSASDYGVNRDGTGELSGYAWGANVGWVHFDPDGGGVSIDPSTGSFDGYAWGENVGWIHFKNDSLPYNVVVTAHRAYLPLALRTYAEAPPTPTETPEPPSVLNNGGFETGDFTGWTTGGYYTRTVETFEPVEGHHIALLGEVLEEPRWHVAASAWIMQTVHVPSGTDPATLGFSYRIFARDRDEDACFRVVLKDMHGQNPVELLRDGYEAIIPPTQLVDLGWKHRTRDLSDYRGQTVQLWFQNQIVTEGAQGTWTYVDAITLH
jgi:hypothetical protein